MAVAMWDPGLDPCFEKTDGVSFSLTSLMRQMYQRREMGVEWVSGDESGLGNSGLWACKNYANCGLTDMYQR
jgi:hypothetical protein